MAYWGIAINRRANPLAGAPDAAALKGGWEAVEKAKSIGPKTDRERDYVAAIGNYYKDWEKLDHQTRVLAYEKSMEQVYVRYLKTPRLRSSMPSLSMKRLPSFLPTKISPGN